MRTNWRTGSVAAALRPGSADRLKLAVYAGGHMFYSHEASRRALRDDAETMYRDALKPAQTGE